MKYFLCVKYRDFSFKLGSTYTNHLVLKELMNFCHEISLRRRVTAHDIPSSTTQVRRLLQFTLERRYVSEDEMTCEASNLY